MKSKQSILHTVRCTCGKIADSQVGYSRRSSRSNFSYCKVVFRVLVTEPAVLAIFLPTSLLLTQKPFNPGTLRFFGVFQVAIGTICHNRGGEKDGC